MAHGTQHEKTDGVPNGDDADDQGGHPEYRDQDLADHPHLARLLPRALLLPRSRQLARLWGGCPKAPAATVNPETSATTKDRCIPYPP